MNVSNIISAVFGYGKTTKTQEVWRIDHGMKLKIVGLNLPAAYQVHFANSPDTGEAVAVVATTDTVDIPDMLFLNGKDVYAWIYLTPEDGVGYTVYMVTIPVRIRPTLSEYEPTPVQENAIDQAIGALNDAVEQTAQDVIDTNAAKEAAEAAQSLAEAAQDAAESSASISSQHAANAATSAASAATSATNAQAERERAEAAENAANVYAQDAAESAEHAEQAAINAGYMEFHIDENGHLIYTRTGFHNTMFALVDGHLILEVS